MSGVPFKKLIPRLAFTLPPKGWVEEQLNQYPHTPDLAYLERYQLQWLFVPCDLQSGHKHANFMEGCKKLEYPVLTKHPFSFWKRTLGQESFPIAFRNKYESAPYAKIKGQLYAIPPRLFILLDKHKGNTVQVHRERTRVQVSYTRFEANDRGSFYYIPDERIDIPAWMYIGDPDYWKDLNWPPLRDVAINTTFEPVRTFTPKKEWLEPYYSFTKQEYDV